MTSILLAVDHDAEASPAVRLAAQELRRLLLATTGRSVAILDAANGTDHKLALTVDPSLTDESGSERDAIAIATTGATGTISGSNPRSLLIAVYRFLTELGCRFVRPGPEGEHLPPIDLDTATVTVRERAAHQHRGVCIEGATSLTNVLDLIEWLPKVGMNSYFIQFESPHVFLRAWYERVRDPTPAPGLEYPITERTAAVHAAVIDAIAERDLIHHAVGHGWTSEVIGIRADGWGRVEGVEFRRELVAEVAGKRELWGGVPLNTELCYSQPEVRTAMATVIAEHARAHPEIDVLHVWLSDGSNNHCECADCSTAPLPWW